MTDKTVKTDPSVKVTDLYLKGDPRGSVPIEKTMAKPEAYSPPTKGPK